MPSREGPGGATPGTAVRGDRDPDALDVLHVDMDCFFAAVEALDEPAIAGKAVIVGGTGPRGVVASCSYEARAKGVRSAMPMAEARRRCPEAVIVPGRHDRYGEVSRELHDVMHEFTPAIEPIALDEAFLDVSGSHLLFGSSEDIARAIRQQVRERLHLECSVGVARSKLLAKLASRDAKPRPSENGPLPGPGVVVVRREEEDEFLSARPVRDIFGVGPKTAARLHSYGVNKVSDLAALEPATLARIVGRAQGKHLSALARGDDPRPVESDRRVKSIGHEETFPRDVREQAVLNRELVRLADSVASRLRSAGVAGRTVSLKVRFGDFKTITRAHSMSRPLATASEIARIAVALLEPVEVSVGVRLIGVSVSGLEEPAAGGDQTSEQLSFGASEIDPQGSEGSGARGRGRPRREAREEVERAVDLIRRRYGQGSVGPAVVVGREGLKVKRPGDSQWGPPAP